jgi:hypothetical protein
LVLKLADRGGIVLLLQLKSHDLLKPLCHN